MLLTSELAERIKDFAHDAGFELCGVASVCEGDFPELDHFPHWLESGQAGEMEYLKSRNDVGELKRASLKNAAPWAKSVIVCALNYNSSPKYSTEYSDPTRGWISRYAWFQHREGKHTDYHDAILHRLRAVESKLSAEWKVKHDDVPIRTWCYVDTGPLVERVYAKYAGIGWIAKNTCIIHQEMGSWLFLGVILTSLEADEGATPSMPPADRCGSCTRCIEACPTGAITEPYKLDARLCISYLTIEKRGDIPEDLRGKMGRHLFGCDICQDVCPWNGGVSDRKRTPVSHAPDFQPRTELVNPPLEWIASMTREEFNAAFRGTPVKRAKYEGLRRNAAIAMGNSGDKKFLPLLQHMAQDENPAVASHAQWSLDKIES